MNNSWKLDGAWLKCGASILTVAALLFCVCCAKTTTNTNSNANSSQTNSTETRAATNSANEPGELQASREPSLVSLSSGAFPLKAPTGSYGRTVTELIDERPKSCWRSENGAADPFCLYFRSS